MTAPYSPIWLTPSSAGALSNLHGSNTDSDGIGFAARYSSPKGAASPLSLARMQAFRSGVGGNPATSTLGWDSGWIGGNPAVQQLASPRQASGGNSTASFNGRLYFMPSDGTLVSCPNSSAAVGTWRYENPVPAGSSGTAPVVYALAIVAGRLYCTATITTYLSSVATLYMAAINADGTVGSWSTVPGGIITAGDATWKNTGLLGGWDGISATGWIFCWHSGSTPFTLTVNVFDGSVTTASTNAANSPSVARDNLSSAFIANATGFKVFFVGGTAAAASGVIDVLTIDASSGICTGANAAKTLGNGGLPAARSGGTLIALQNGILYYMGGSSTNLASGATTTVYKSTATLVNANGVNAWTASARTLPTAAWLAGGGLTMTDYDLLGSAGGLGDNAIETITAGTLNANADTMAIASFKPSTTYALRVNGQGALATGSNTAVTPAYGSAGAPVLNNLIVAWVSGSDHTPGTGGQTLGETSVATTGYDIGQATNEVFTAATFTTPAAGCYVNSISVYMGGYGGTVATKLCVWNATTGALITNSAQFNAPNGLALRTQSVGSVFIAGSTSIAIGFWHPSSVWAQWGAAATGTFKYKNSQSAPGSISGATTCGGAFYCGHLQAYITYTTVNAPSPISATAGWNLASDSPNGDEETQIWYKVAAGGDAAPTFSTAGGSSPIYAQLAEFTGGATASVVDSSGVRAQASNSNTMSVSNAAADAQSGDLILFASRWALQSAGTASFVSTLNNGVSVTHAGDTGASSTTRHASFNYGIIPSAPTPSRTPDVVVIGGQGIGGAARNLVYSAAVVGGDIQPWSTVVGAGTVATAGTLASDSSAILTPNQDGSLDVTLQYGSLGTLAGILSGTIYIPSFNDGDLVTVTAQFVGLDGDPSPLASTLITIGQPPSLSLLTPSGAIVDGDAPISFAVSPGAGGGPQATWRASIVGATTATVYADSLIRTDQANFWHPPIAPQLNASESYTLSVTATSNDFPLDADSTNSASASVSFSVSGTAPPAPGSITIATSTVLSGIILTWTNAGGSGVDASVNRIYYRRSGQSAWSLLVDNIPALVGTAQSYTLIDQLPMTASFDLALSAIDSSGGLESSLSSPIILSPGFEIAGTGSLWKSLGTDATGSLTYWNQIAGSWTIASNIVTIPNVAGALMVGGHPDWQDISSFNLRIKWVGGASVGAVFHCDGSDSNWIGARLAGTPQSIHVDKMVGGTYTADIVAAQTVTLTSGTFYWIQFACVGTAYTIKFFNDSAGAIGSQLGSTFSLTVNDRTLQSGMVGIRNWTTAATTAGGAFVGVCAVNGPSPAQWGTAIYAGEPAFCLSKLNPFAGTYSASICNAGPAGAGAWNSGLLATLQGTTYNWAGEVRSVGQNLINNGFESASGVTQTVHNDPFNNLNSLANVNGTSFNLAANLISRGAADGTMTFGHPDWWDATITVRVQWVTSGVIRLYLHYNGSSFAVRNDVHAYVDGVNILLIKEVNGSATTVIQTPAALVTGTFYWLRISGTGTSYTATIFNDTAGAIGAQISTTTSAIGESACQTGKSGLTLAGATVQAGGAFSNICTVTAPTPPGWQPAVSGVGNTDFGSACWSLSRSHLGSKSLSWWAPTANAYGFWQSAAIPTFAGSTLAINCWTQGPNVTAPGGFYLLTDNVVVNSTFQTAWALDSTTITPAGTGVQDLLLRPGNQTGLTVGTYYWDDLTVAPVPATSTVYLGNLGTPATATPSAWTQVTSSGVPGPNVNLAALASGLGIHYFDNVSVNLSGSQGITVPTPAGGYTAMLHLPGSTNVYAPVMLSGGPGTKEHLESLPALVFGSAAPLVRIGGYDYREFDLTLIEYVAGDFTALQSVLSVMRQGTPVYLRTAAGHLLLVALKPDQEIAFLPQAYTSLRTCKLGLIQAPNPYSPSLPWGMAQGLLTQVGGSVPPLDPAELGF